MSLQNNWNSEIPFYVAILLSLVTVFQYLENIPDRVAAHCAVVRMDWKHSVTAA